MSEVEAGSPDLRMLHRIAQRVTPVLGSAGDPAAAVFDTRFPMGARVPGVTGEDAVFRVDDPVGRGWQTAGSWDEVTAAAAQAGDTGFAVVALADPGQGAAGIHVRVVGDGVPVLWFLHVRRGAEPAYGPFTELASRGLPDPRRVVVVNCCGEVQLPFEE